MKKILLITLFTIIVFLPLSVHSKNDALLTDSREFQYQVVNNIKFYKLTSITQALKLRVLWSDYDKSVTVESKDGVIVFYTGTNKTKVKENIYDYGDIKLIDGFTFIPEKALQVFGISTEYEKAPDSQGSDLLEGIQTYTLPQSNNSFINLREFAIQKGYQYQWHVLNKYAEAVIEGANVYFILDTNTIIKNNSASTAYEMLYLDNNIYIQYESLEFLLDIDLELNNNDKPSIEDNKEQEANQEKPKEDNTNDTDTSSYLPLREIGQLLNAQVQWDDLERTASLSLSGITLRFNTKNMQVKFNNILIDNLSFIYKNGITYVPKNLSDIFLKNTILYSTVLNNESIIITGKSINVKTHYPLENPNRIVVDVLNTDNIEETLINADIVKKLRVIKEANLSRLVLDINKSSNYILNKTDSYVHIELGKTNNTPPVNNEVDPNKNSTNNSQDDKQEQNINKKKLSLALIKDSLELQYSVSSDYTIKRISDPDRIIVFIPDAYIEQGSSPVITSDGSKYIKKISINNLDKGVQIEIFLTAQCRYEITSSGNKLIMDFYTQKILNLSYYNSSDRKYILLNGLELANQLGEIKPSVGLSNDTSVIKLTFKDSSYKLTAGVLYVNDSYIDRIQIIRAEENVTLLIYTKQLIELYINCPSSSHTSINLLPKNNNFAGSVVIDPGHGGYDPGAVVGNVYESTLNLAISKKVIKILNEKGINTFMMRNTDEYVGLYERAHIANALDASLFISIHCNALVNPDYDGIMTLIHPSSNKGRALGKLLQDKLVSATAAADRGVIDRPNLVVLKATSMPAALVECGFMTNREELNMLMTEDYQNIIAQSIAVGIIESINSR